MTRLGIIVEIVDDFGLGDRVKSGFKYNVEIPENANRKWFTETISPRILTKLADTLLDSDIKINE